MISKQPMIKKGATISDCGLYRYELWRIWDETKPNVMFVMHNPSIANGDDDDPTINRCIEFAISWGYGGIYIGNLSPFKATNPKNMLGKSFDILAPLSNIAYLKRMQTKCEMHVVAYGNPIIKDLIPTFVDDKWHYLKLTKANNPWHPLYLKKDLKPLPNYNEKRLNKTSV